VSRDLHLKSLVAPLALYALTALAIVAVWWWLGAPVSLPPSPLADGGKLYCVSYAPFRDAQDPLVEGTRVSAEQIDEDLAYLSHYANCIRTYSVDDGRDDVLKSARRYGLKVLHGIWVSNDRDKTRRQIEATVALAKEYSDVITAVVVGNEVLLRGEMSPADLIGYIRDVKSRVAMPVTYADVWEFWLRYPDVQSAVDFVTVHILPYWEDFPIPASLAAAHVEAIHKKVADAFPNKEILIGEFGWPSAGRMREGARPSPSNQGKVIAETLAMAEREHFRVNVIEAFDQPWKRALEGVVGGYWGIFDRGTGKPKFGATVSDHPHWIGQAVAGIVLAGLIFAAAWGAGRGKSEPPLLWPRIAILAFLPAVLFGWTLEMVPIESIGIGGWLRSLAFAATAAAAPIACAAACAAGRKRPSFAVLLSHAAAPLDGLGMMLGVSFAALTLLSVQTALGLVFDPRYRDLPFAPQSAAVIAFLIVAATGARPQGPRAMAETVAAAVLALSAVYIVFNETFANWQAIWLCAGLVGLAVILARARDVPG
jgi:exo-beta-1,3-glucanase (GH17 family)